MPAPLRLGLRVGSLLAGLVVMTACRIGAGPSPATPDPTEDDSPSATGDASTTAPTPAVYRFAWGHTTGDWNAAVAVAPAGWVLSAGSRIIRVHASDDGRVLESTRGCRVADNGLAIFSDTEGAVVCANGELRSLTFPGLAQEPVGKVAENIKVVGWGGGLVATGHRDGQVNVVKRDTWQAVDSFTLPHEIEGVAVDPQGRWVAAGHDEGGTFIRDLATGTTRELITTDRRPTAMAASPDGTRLFVNDSSFEARVYAVDDAAIERAHECGSWLTGARWLDPELIAATGSDGFVLYAKGSSRGHRLLDPDAEHQASHEWLGASADGTIVCSGDRDGRIACFSTAAMPASTYEPAPAVAAQTAERGDTGASRPSAPDPGPLLTGTIESRKGKTLKIRASTEARPAVGTTGSLSRRFERTMGRMTMTGWMGIAKVEVASVSGDTVVLKILEETSNVKINGKTQNQFQRGFEVKLESGD